MTSAPACIIIDVYAGGSNMFIVLGIRLRYILLPLEFLKDQT
nr:unnamed protein product [Callosobruchus chinensis]